MGGILTEQLFWDLIRVHYAWELSKVPEFCECGAKLFLHHVLSCKNVGFTSIRHNNIRKVTFVTANLLKVVCRDVRTKPKLQPLTGERFEESTASIVDEAPYDVSARSFWPTGQVTFLDIRILTQASTDMQTKASVNPMKSMKRRRKELITKEFKKSSMVCSLR